MPDLLRSDGTRICWRDQGVPDGPLIVIVLQFFGLPEVFGTLIRDLERDHRIVTYDPRGIGSSVTAGPISMQGDGDDLAALVFELGQQCLLLAWGDGLNRSIRTALALPELVVAVLSPGGNPAAREAAEGTDALVASQPVLEAITGQMETDYRGALRALFASVNPDFDEGYLRDRVQKTIEHCPHDVAVARFREWVDDDVLEQARTLAGRLWLIEHGGNPWFPIEVFERTRAILPDAHMEVVEGGPISRPEIAASYARRILAANRAPVAGGD